jgi:hypothetical protein
MGEPMRRRTKYPRTLYTDGPFEMIDTGTRYELHRNGRRIYQSPLYTALDYCEVHRRFRLATTNRKGADE